jgi:hypothetical protein
VDPAASATSAAYDWTYTTPFAGSVVCAPPAAAAAVAPATVAAPAAPSVSPTWQAVDERIDRTLLLARDPILFFDELTLYESELDDNGTMSLAVKARARRGACSVPWLRFCMRSSRCAVAGHANALREMHGRAGPCDAVVLVCAAALLAARGQCAVAVRSRAAVMRSVRCCGARCSHPACAGAGCARRASFARLRPAAQAAPHCCGSAPSGRRHSRRSGLGASAHE